MSRHQLAFSILCILCSVTGLFAIVRHILIGFDGLVGGAFGLMFLFAWVAIRIMRCENVTDEAIFRLKNAPQWGELSPLRRHCLMLLDWPLFFAIREREMKRLLDQQLTRVVFDAQGVTLAPLEAQHTEAYFLTQIASAAGGRGLKVRNAIPGIFGPRWASAKNVELTWLESDSRIWSHARDELVDGAPVSLRQFRRALECGYISTLSEGDRSKYYWENR